MLGEPQAVGESLHLVGAALDDLGPHDLEEEHVAGALEDAVEDELLVVVEGLDADRLGRGSAGADEAGEEAQEQRGRGEERCGRGSNGGGLR
ncbi:MAG: hypothetical protein CO108_14540 [Deltaproteobacteria bacterium CG_4_9_14_3_um_filter_63_12]|nr:MAG: hypothetical protein CO108_14540 [Deltaproteobacteria bacterium CG_4_9_14_3_um_filter_63_12]